MAIVNFAHGSGDEATMGSDAAGYIAQRKLLFKYMDTADRTWTARRRAALDVWLGLIASKMDLDADIRFPS